MNKPDAWMPWHIGDYLADTMHLTRDQHGGYDLLLMAYWRTGGPLDDDDGMLAQITKATPAEWRRLRPVLTRFFRIADGKWHQKRADHELAAAEQRRKKAERAARVRYGEAPQAGIEQPPSMSQAAPEQPPSTAKPLLKPGSVSVSESSDDDDAGARDPKREVLEAIGVWDDARWLGSGALVASWMAAGADLDLDILPTVKAVMAKRGNHDPPSSLKYFDRPVMDAFATRTTPARPGKPNGAQGNRPDRPDRTAKLREAVARTFSDVAGGSEAD